MTRINLLPHREAKRNAQKKQFLAFGVLTCILGSVIVGMGHVTLVAQIEWQERRNAYLNKEITLLDHQIDEIKKLKEQTKILLARKTVVENLQSTRSDVVHLMDQMLRILPDGVSLKSLKQTGTKIDLVGQAQSNARVSTLMRSIEASEWLSAPTLVEIHATTLGVARLNEFLLNFNLAKPSPEISPARTLSSGPQGKPLLEKNP